MTGAHHATVLPLWMESKRHFLLPPVALAAVAAGIRANGAAAYG